MANSVYTRPPREDRGPRAADCCAPCPRRHTPPSPGKGWTAKKPRPPSHRISSPSPAAPGAGRANPSLGRGNRLGARLRPALYHPLLPSPTLLGPRVRGPRPRHPSRPARARAPALPPRRVGGSARLPAPRPLSRLFQFSPPPSRARGPQAQPAPLRWLSRPEAGTRRLPGSPETRAPSRRGCAVPSVGSARRRGWRPMSAPASVSSGSSFQGREPLGHSPSRLLPHPPHPAAPALMSRRRRSQWRLGTSARPLGLLGSNLKACDFGSFVRGGSGGRPGPGAPLLAALRGLDPPTPGLPGPAARLPPGAEHEAAPGSSSFPALT